MAKYNAKADVTRLISCKDVISKRKEIWFARQSVEDDRAMREATAIALVDPQKGQLMAQEIKNNPEHMIEMFFIVVDKNKKTMPFFLSEVQRDFLERIKNTIQDYKEGRCHFMGFLVLKGRQQG